MGLLDFVSGVLKHKAASNLLKSHLTQLCPHTYDYAAKVGVKGITRGGYFKRNLRRTAAKDIFTSIYGEQVQGYLVCIVYTSNFAFAMSGGVLMSSIGVISPLFNTNVQFCNICKTTDTGMTYNKGHHTGANSEW